jgi:FkbM family methyltransferase
MKFFLRLIRLVNSKFHKTHRVFKDKKYFEHLFKEKSDKYNINAIDFSSGITSGSFKDINFFIYFRPGDFLEGTIYTEGCWEKHIISLISQSLGKSTGIMLDIGANVGLISIPLAIKHKNTQFYCFEAHPRIFHRLENNVNLNKISNIKTVNCAISNSKEKKLTFYAQKQTSNMGLSSLKLNPDIKNFEEISIFNDGIDNIFIDSSEPVSLIKIDTQGSEIDVLESGMQIIKRDRPIIIFEFEDSYYLDEDRENSKKLLDELFKDINYSLFNISKDINYFPKVDIRKKYNGDILCMPN